MASGDAVYDGSNRMSRYTSANAFGFLLTDSARLFRQLCDRELIENGVGLSTGDIRALSHVIRYQASTQAILAERMAIEPMTLSASLDRLEKVNLIVRVKGPDRRTKLINPTAEGMVVFESLTPIFDDIVGHCLNGMSEEEIEAVTSLLIRLRANLTSDRELLSDAPSAVQ